MKVSEFFKQRKKGETGKRDAAPAAAAAAASAAQTPLAAPAQEKDGFEAAGAKSEEDVLRGFDLSSKFGPCTGMTRLERWERANKLGLEPPEEVRRILVAAGPDSPANLNLWNGRV